MTDPEARTQDIAGPIVQFAPPFNFQPSHPKASAQIDIDYPMPIGDLIPGTDRFVSIRSVMDPMRGRLCYAYDTLE
jgi:hypothetical protein